MSRYFAYGDEATDYLKAHDKRLGQVIDIVGHVWREMGEEDLFAGIVHHIVGQQISSAAQATVWERLQGLLGEVTPASVGAVGVEGLRSCGITLPKARYIQGAGEACASGSIDLDALSDMPDEEAISHLSSLPGVGRWTAEMLLLFNLGRPDVLSFGDLAIQRGMRMTYHHKLVTRQMFERYRLRYSPYGSVASLYLWEVSKGGVPGFDRDFAPKRSPGRRLS